MLSPQFPICAWCGAYLGEIQTENGPAKDVSRVICQDCARKMCPGTPPITGIGAGPDEPSPVGEES